MVEERHKRALPARHSFLTDAVSSVLESQSSKLSIDRPLFFLNSCICCLTIESQMPQIDSRTILKLDQDTSFCKLHDESTQTCTSPAAIPRPVFRVLPHRRLVKNKVSRRLSS